jgi:hypothetical protein
MRTLSGSQLRHVLLIPDPKQETIFGVVGRMETLIGIFEGDERYHGLLPFLKTYYFVTKASAEIYVKKKDFFRSLRDYEILDVYFATLYFTPLLRFLTDGKHEPPWKTYFDYVRKPDGKQFLRLLLGVNAHINGDLCKAVVDLNYRHERDFFLVNDILLAVIPKVTQYMVFSEHDLFSASGLVFKDFFRSEFHNVVEKWRSEAWAQATCHGKNGIRSAHKNAERIGVSLLSDFENRAALPFLIHSLSADAKKQENELV